MSAGGIAAPQLHAHINPICATARDPTYLAFHPFQSSSLAFKRLSLRKPTKQHTRSTTWKIEVSGRLVIISQSKNDVNSCKVARNEQVQATDLVEKFSEGITWVVKRAVEVLHKPAITALVLALLLTQNPGDALAASGGRVGGRAFSSRSGGGGGGPSYSIPYSAPRSSFGFYAPFSPPGLYVGPAYGVGIGGGGFFVTLLLGFLAFQLVSSFLSDREEEGLFTGTQKSSVLKLQVGLLGLARSLQRDLDKLANRADTSSPEGLHYILSETVLSLLRHPDFCISSTSSYEIKRTIEGVEQRFNQLSLEERGKFDEETLVSVDNLRRRVSSGLRSERINNEYIVVTLLVATQGEYKLPPVNSNADLKEALTRLGSIPSDQILAVEVLWTPQDENDTLSERQLLQDYPLLRPL